MSEQEMLFADPAWKPSTPLEAARPTAPGAINEGFSEDERERLVLPEKERKLRAPNEGRHIRRRVFSFGLLLTGAGLVSGFWFWKRSSFPANSLSYLQNQQLQTQPSAQQPQMWPPAHNFAFFLNPTFTAIAMKEVASALHLTPEQITPKMVNANYGLSAIAADQGLPFNKLYPIEQKAVNDMLDAEIQAGYIRSEEATQWKNLFWDNPGKLDNVMGSMFSGFPVDISY